MASLPGWQRQDFRDLPYTNSWLMNISLLAEVCAFLSDIPHAVTLYDLLLPYATHNVVIGGDAVGYQGAVARLLGFLATTLQRWEPAVQHFEAALSMQQRMGARPFVARTQYAYAAMLVARNAPGDAAQAQTLLALACATTQDLQMQGLMPHLQELQSRIPPVSTPDDDPRRRPRESQRSRARRRDNARARSGQPSQPKTSFAKRAIIGPWPTRGEPVISKTPEGCVPSQSSCTHRARNSTSSTS